MDMNVCLFRLLNFYEAPMTCFLSYQPNLEGGGREFSLVDLVFGFPDIDFVHPRLELDCY